MKCQVCGKKEATVRYYENINGKQKEIILCEDCSENIGFGGFSNMFSPMFTSFGNSFEGLGPVTSCPECGYTFDKYAQTGLFGCPKCYETFNEKLDRLFLKIHGKNEHVELQQTETVVKEDVAKSKVEHKAAKKVDRVLSLKEKLKELVASEKYEDAAVVRDQIKKLEK